MNTVTHQLPLPVGVRFSAPTRRVRVDVWAAPDPAALVLDPWAAPVGEPIARTRLSPWAAPSPKTRIAWMAAPAVLLPAPTPNNAVRIDAAKSADRALATLRTLADAPRGSFPSSSDAAAVLDDLEPAWASTFAAPNPAARVDPVATTNLLPAPADLSESIDDRRRSVVRWRAVAIVSGVGAAAAATVTLLAALL